ncbi:MAG: Hsp20/alpha crystallin family protein [Phycisphaerae bacterium]|nr:Hsp20/alpha crystallin family protein [Phycisphaerae bacterium]
MTTQQIEKRQSADVARADQEKPQYFQPSTDVRETDDQIIIQFDMPGVSSDNVNLTVEKGTLTVTGKADPEETGQVVYRETHVGDYQRTFSLSDDVDTEGIMADMKAGILTVRIPKAEKAKPKRIAITSA